MAHVYENVTKKPITSYAKKSINKEHPLLERHIHQHNDDGEGRTGSSTVEERPTLITQQAAYFYYRDDDDEGAWGTRCQP